MSHLFDFSSSKTGITEFSGHSLSNLFGRYSGMFLPAEYWNPLGTLQGIFSYYWEGWDGEGNWVEQVDSFRLHVDGWGNYSTELFGEAADDYWPNFWADDPELFASTEFFTGSSQLTLFSFYEGYLRFEALPTVTRSLGVDPDRIYTTYSEAVDASVVAHEYANAGHLAALRALQPATLATAGRIIAENFGPDPEAGTIRLVYTPDPNTKVTFADWIGLDPSGMDDAYTAQLEDTRSLFADEDVTILLTDEDDRFSDYGAGFSARTLLIEAGAGNDDITVMGDGWGYNSSSDSVPLHIVVNGGDGDDFISVAVKGTATIHGGTGDDVIYGTAMDASPAGYFEVHAGEGDDFVQGINDGENLIFGGDGNDMLIGGFDSADTIFGGDGDDTIWAGSYWDSFTRQNIYSDFPNLFYGGDGNDVIGGGIGNDTIFGGDGDDWIGGGRGNNLLYGGSGLDTYSLALGNTGEIEQPFGDTIIFDDGGIIEFAAWMSSSLNLSELARSANDLIIGTLGHSSIRLVGFYDNPEGWSTSGTEGFIDFAYAATLEALHQTQVMIGVSDLSGAPVSDIRMLAKLPDGTVTELGFIGAVGQVFLPMMAEGELLVMGSKPYDPATDGAITAGDALDVLRLAVGLSPGWGAANPLHYVAADINQDGVVSAADALDVLRVAVGLPSTRAPEWVFIDSDADLSGIDRINTTVAQGLRIDPFISDLQDLSMTGILLGNMQEHVT